MLSESIPSLLPLLLDLESMSILGGRGTTGLSLLRGVGEVGAEDPRRIEGGVALSCRMSEFRVSAATTLEMETEVVAGVKAGRRILGCRRGVLLPSSAAFRLGEEWVDWELSPLRRSMDALEVLRREKLSEAGREDDISAELEALDGIFEPGVAVPGLPLPVCGTFMGLEADLERRPFIAAALPLRAAALDGDLRLPAGDDW